MRTRAVVLRGLHVDFRAICDGRELKSPDERFTATATSTYGPRYCGGSRSYYEFAVENRERTRLQSIVIQVPRENLINWRLEGLISWADDSSSVTFEFQRKSLTLSIGQAEQVLATDETRIELECLTFPAAALPVQDLSPANGCRRH